MLIDTTWTSLRRMPPAWPSILSTREAAKQVKVCLSGEGADEFFGGYNIYKEPFTVSWVTISPCPSGGPSARWRSCPGARRKLSGAASRPLEERYIGNTEPDG